MREIKFRAWDGKVLFQPFKLLDELNKAYVGPFEAKTKFLQFTGLLDKAIDIITKKR